MTTSYGLSVLPDKAIKDIRNQRFGRLVVIEYSHCEKGGAYWQCNCDCGDTIIARGYSLKSGDKKSCGCLYAENTKHAMSKSAEFKIWAGMIKRCYNPNCIAYERYGHSGIIVCDRWRDSFENFYADMGPRPSRHYSIDRVDNDGPYAPENCRWATIYEQMNNKRSCHMISHNGVTQSIADWARQLDIPYRVLSSRILRGMSIKKAFTAQRLDNNPNTHRITYRSETKTISEWSAQVGIAASTLCDRLERGWLPEQILTTPAGTNHTGNLLAFNGEIKSISEWARTLHVNRAALSKRLKRGWSVERTLSTPA